MVILAVSVSVTPEDIKQLDISPMQILSDCLISFFRILLPIMAAMIIGSLTGYILFSSSLIKKLSLPFINFVRHISPFAWLPFAIIWFGLGEYPIFFILMVTLFFPVVIASEEIYSRISNELREEAEVAGATKTQLLSRIYFPLTLPSLINLFRIMWSLGWTTLIAAEMLGVNRGLGFRLLEYRYLIQHDKMFLYLIILGFIGITSDFMLRKLMKGIERKVFT
jgi:NitT/TauT family transport system permease protein